MKALLAIAAGLAAGAAAAEPSVERGSYLVTGPAGCGNCHSPLGPDGFTPGKELSGRLVLEVPEFTAYSANITPAGRVADWTDEEFARAIREGLRPDGSLIGPPMPFAMYRGLSDDDVMSIVAYLRTIPAVENEVPESIYNIPLPPDHGPKIDHVADIPAGVTVEYGAYLAGPVAHCMECHTPMGPEGPMLDTALGQGGFAIPGPWGVSVSSNLTTHVDGLAGYSDDELATMITKGMRPDGSQMMPPMPYPFLAKMTEDDLAAIILYLRTLPPLPDYEG
ncbi:Alcohol dehydrogenase cytochrome c subunit [Defluviimonas aquaemixtae]|uniref:Alcohol dehydrogenase cytochrome c subunit n=1 Tax=Albidovulum aquaemixtae TaxID=1542388 RepID=A0A2R8B4P9_9RHOB|nr:c-type cytochrome [Defluviimonas aquaemixtae]SPH17596.1 Alcohol dehydrogenase cytochrome c subunit [Defluviimonas aquaemixtae]